MDDQLVLRSIGETLARESPLLAAALTGPLPARRQRRFPWLLAALFALSALALATVLPLTVFVGLFAVLLVAASPVLGCLACESARSDGTPR